MLATHVLPCFEQVYSKLKFSESAFKHLTDSSTDFRSRVGRLFMMCVRQVWFRISPEMQDEVTNVYRDFLLSVETTLELIDNFNSK